MSAKRLLYIKSFLSNTGLILLIYFIGDYFTEADSVEENLLFIFLYGLLMSFFSVLSHLDALREMGVWTFDAEALNTHRKATISSQKNLQEIHDLLLTETDNFTISSIENNQITLKSKRLLLGIIFASKLSIKLIGKEYYEISSRPFWPFTNLDNGANRKHIKLLTELLEKA